jgi:hypothetical protein
MESKPGAQQAVIITASFAASLATFWSLYTLLDVKFNVSKLIKKLVA